jgi:hypothetical protein
MTADVTMPKIREFIQNGGTVIAMGATATNLAAHLALPISNHLVEPASADSSGGRGAGTAGGMQPLSANKFYVPGSVVRVNVDNTALVAAGLPTEMDMFFDNSPVWRLGPNAAAQGVRRIAWYGSRTPLRSGWAWGQNYLEGGVAVIEATVGKGKVYLFGPDVNQRAQTHGAFKYLFNGIYNAAATPARM